MRERCELIIVSRHLTHGRPNILLDMDRTRIYTFWRRWHPSKSNFEHYPVESAIQNTKKGAKRTENRIRHPHIHTEITALLRHSRRTRKLNRDPFALPSRLDLRTLKRIRI